MLLGHTLRAAPPFCRLFGSLHALPLGLRQRKKNRVCGNSSNGCWDAQQAASLWVQRQLPLTLPHDDASQPAQVQGISRLRHTAAAHPLPGAAAAALPPCQWPSIAAGAGSSMAVQEMGVRVGCKRARAAAAVGRRQKRHPPLPGLWPLPRSLAGAPIVPLLSTAPAATA